MVMSGFFFVATSISRVGRLRLIYDQFRRPTLLVCPLPLLRLSTRPLQSRPFPRELEDWLEAQPQRFVLLGITVDSYDAVIWVTSQLSEPLNSWWLNRKHHTAIPTTSDMLVEVLRKISMLPNIQDDAIINAPLNISEGNMNYAVYT
jgi:hypothetical protein